MDGPFVPQGSQGFSHPPAPMASHQAAQHHPARAGHLQEQWQAWQNSLPYNSPSQQAAAFSGYHPSANAWFQSYPAPEEYYGPNPCRYATERPGFSQEDFRRPRSPRGRSRSKGPGAPPPPDSRRSTRSLSAGRAPSEVSGRSSSRSKRSLAKSVYVDDLHAPKEPGTRPLSLRELADFDYNEKGRMVVQRHSTFGSPGTSLVPRPPRSRSPSPAPPHGARDVKGKERVEAVRDREREDEAPSSSTTGDNAAIEELRVEVARLKAQLQAQEEENARRRAEEAQSLKAELMSLHAKSEAMGLREPKTSHQAMLKEEELDLVRQRLEMIAQQMSEMRTRQQSRPRSERRSVTRSHSQGTMPAPPAPRSGRRTPNRTRLIEVGSRGDMAVLPQGTTASWESPPEGTLLYRTVDENGHEVEYREVAVIRQAPGERKIISETVVEPGGARHPKARPLEPKSGGDVKKGGDSRRSPEGRPTGEAKLPPLPPEKAAWSEDYPEDDLDDPWEMPESPVKGALDAPPEAPRQWAYEGASPVKPAARPAQAKPRAQNPPPRPRAASRSYSRKKPL